LGRELRKRERSRVLDGEGEAQVIALMCSEPVVGQSRWTLKLLGHRVVDLGIVESISHETIRQVLKKYSGIWISAYSSRHILGILPSPYAMPGYIFRDALYI